MYIEDRIHTCMRAKKRETINKQRQTNKQGESPFNKGLTFGAPTASPKAISSGHSLSRPAPLADDHGDVLEGAGLRVPGKPGFLSEEILYAPARVPVRRGSIYITNWGLCTPKSQAVGNEVYIRVKAGTRLRKL